MHDRHSMTRRRFALAGAALITTGAGIPLATRAHRASEDATPNATPPGATPHTGEEVTVGMTMDLQFDPEDLVIPAGTTVTWVNDSAMPHTATGDPEVNPLAETNPEYVKLPDGAEPWGSELLQPGESYSHTFDTPGEYHYICIPHVMSGMRGTITVES